MKKLGLIGYPLSHSFSKKYFKEKFLKENITGYSYDTFPLETISEFKEFLKKEKDLLGLSVTIPYKETVIPFLDELDETAEEIGAVNCIKFTNGKLIGYNTDAFGFKQSLRPFLDTNHTKALIFGTGGASKAVAYVLRNSGITFWFVSRTKNNFGNTLMYEELTEDVISACKLLVNCTPVGMSPNDDKFLPLPYSSLTPQHLVYDLIYNPAETLFLKKAKEQGALVSNGYNMLVFQAEEAWRIWNK
ncbi:MAG TPA: shikimate dehydrogenase [Bacteroidia bacterium]|nr:shikimate dehydrogenase [Bacteroidia bacterium]